MDFGSYSVKSTKNSHLMIGRKQSDDAVTRGTKLNIQSSHVVLPLQRVGLMVSRCFKMIAHITKSLHNIFTVEVLFHWIVCGGVSFSLIKYGFT